MNKSMLYSIPQSHIIIIERFGKYNRVQREGLNFKLPFIEKIKYVKEWGQNANKDGYLIEMSEQNTDTPARQIQTSDNVTIHIDASINWKIIEPEKAVYRVDVLPKAVLDVSMNTLRSIIGSITFDELLTKREDLKDKICNDLDQIGENWGVDFTRIEIKELKYSKETTDAMMQEMTAERRRRAMVSESEGKASSEVKIAEATARADLIKAYSKAKELKVLAEAEANYIEKLIEKVSPNEAINILKSQKYLDSMDKISQNPSNKVFLPHSMQNMFYPGRMDGQEAPIIPAAEN